MEETMFLSYKYIVTSSTINVWWFHWMEPEWLSTFSDPKCIIKYVLKLYIIVLVVYINICTICGQICKSKVNTALRIYFVNKETTIILTKNIKANLFIKFSILKILTIFSPLVTFNLQYKYAQQTGYKVNFYPKQLLVNKL